MIVCVFFCHYLDVVGDWNINNEHFFCESYSLWIFFIGWGRFFISFFRGRSNWCWLSTCGTTVWSRCMVFWRKPREMHKSWKCSLQFRYVKFEIIIHQLFSILPLSYENCNNFQFEVSLVLIANIWWKLSFTSYKGIPNSNLNGKSVVTSNLNVRLLLHLKLILIYYFGSSS